MTEYTNHELADICDRAADEMTIRGSTAGTMMELDGKVCINGALVHALGRNDRFHLSETADHYNYDPLPTDTGCMTPGPPVLQNALCAAADDLVPGKDGVWRKSWIFNDFIDTEFYTSSPYGVENPHDLRIECLRRAGKFLREQA